MMPQTVPRPTAGAARCKRCILHARCLPLGLERDALQSFDAILQLPRPLKRGETLVRQGDPFTSLYVVRSGSLKQSLVQGGRRGQVLNFYLAGEIVGLDGIGEQRYHSSVVALEATFVCKLPFTRLEDLAERVPGLRGQLYRCMSRELRNDQRMLCLLSGRTAEQRLASFLIGLSERFRSRGCSPYRFHLSMSRSDIASYLGLVLETVSRTLARFQEQGMLSVSGRELVIHDHEALSMLAREGVSGGCRLAPQSD
ncbi:fumarate/nitrate reduction transcriptional regulator Fnr [Billgrantia tianxiuensis]|uniref:Fumarate/nitrate reduction transcriptional regulator Fnr n=1 Tax=Billgrantia tianxiuensis TaxID=2497861 RepID=A0A6I6SQN5_9GAMM|nr:MULTISPECIES: fumarate/nitrate reduction transcriptional regulator Fnr [Halomonas]MCE8034265.1 fumarate/nitrate reduction transcriptional regulator Fnr [Halomonas sp. MCCC 1A11057]QHC50926.1 fumarate/nitrate reduction transcriptional regulator Fnr [Halomonas tianxiuensis]